LMTTSFCVHLPLQQLSVQRLLAPSPAYLKWHGGHLAAGLNSETVNLS